MNNEPIELYKYADERGIDIDWFDLMQAASLSVPLPDGSTSIAINPWKMETLAKETVSLAHELGHCETGSFYSPYATLDIRQKHENQADRWAILRLIPATALERAAADGYTELWQLAEYFNVTLDFMKKAVCLHTCGNLAADMYF
jgi:Zn-dependent peptidase ImmA (M78 family)